MRDAPGRLIERIVRNETCGRGSDIGGRISPLSLGGAASRVCAESVDEFSVDDVSIAASSLQHTASLCPTSVETLEARDASSGAPEDRPSTGSSSEQLHAQSGRSAQKRRDARLTMLLVMSRCDDGPRPTRPGRMMRSTSLAVVRARESVARSNAPYTHCVSGLRFSKPESAIVLALRKAIRSHLSKEDHGGSDRRHRRGGGCGPSKRTIPIGPRGRARPLRPRRNGTSKLWEAPVWGTLASNERGRDLAFAQPPIGMRPRSRFGEAVRRVLREVGIGKLVPQRP